jgi:Domain of unknown function (DUF4157)
MALWTEGMSWKHRIQLLINGLLFSIFSSTFKNLIRHPLSPIVMHQNPVQQHKAASPLSADAESEGNGKKITPPTFQLKTSESPAAPPTQLKQAQGGMPADLVSGFAASTGHDLSNVNVVRNSSKPAEVGALAFAQGNDIHLGAGQDQHLAHEAAHIVQQREGRVQPTTQVGGKPVNDSPALEGEADRMGAKAAQMKSAENVSAKVSEGREIGVSMQRMEAPVQYALDKEDLGAIAAHVHTAVTAVDADAEGAFVALQKLERKAAVISSFKTAYKTAFGTELEADIRKGLSDESLTLSLELIGVKDDPKAADMLSAKAPSKKKEWAATVTRLETALAAASPSGEQVFATLIPFDRDAKKLKKLKTEYETKTKLKLEDDLKAKLVGSELAYALYLLNAPKPTTTTMTTPIAATGAEKAADNVPGGKISARLGDSVAGFAESDNMFSLDYTGGLANETRWLQFIWREILPTDAAGKTTPLVDPITTTGGTYNLTDDPAHPNYNTDTGSATSPFYEAEFFSGRTADSTTIYDQPGSVDKKVQDQFAAGATKVVSRAHFNTFLIRDFRPMEQVAITVEWTYTSAALPPRVQTVDDKGACTALPEGMKKRLVAQFPAYSYIE